MTGTQILAGFASIGAVVQLTPAGVVNVESPDAPELERLVAEVKANRAEVVAELKRHAVPGLPGRAERPCLACGRECREDELFHDGTCFERWKERRRLSTRPATARTAAPPARSIPPSAIPDGGAA